MGYNLIRAEMEMAVIAVKRNNRPRSEAIEELQIIADGVEKYEELAQEVLQAIMPGNGSDGSPLTDDRAEQVKQRIKLRPPKKQPAPADKHFLLTWRRAVLSFKGPPSSTMKLVLVALSQYMDMRGHGAFPSQERLARDCSLSVPAVRTHLRKAEELGWITRTRRESLTGTHAGFDHVAKLPMENQ